MTILICISLGGHNYQIGDMIRITTVETDYKGNDTWIHKGMIRSEVNWRLAKGLEIDIYYQCMLNIPESLKKLQ